MIVDRHERLMRRVEIDADTGCWNRSGANVKGYPTVKIEGRQFRAARLAALAAPPSSGQQLRR